MQRHKNETADILDELRQQIQGMEVNAACMKAMLDTLMARRALPPEEWSELVRLVRARVAALTNPPTRGNR